jgi:hypothetical protein
VNRFTERLWNEALARTSMFAHLRKTEWFAICLCEPDSPAAKVLDQPFILIPEDVLRRSNYLRRPIVRRKIEIVSQAITSQHSSPTGSTDPYETGVAAELARYQGNPCANCV